MSVLSTLGVSPNDCKRSAILGKEFPVACWLNAIKRILILCPSKGYVNKWTSHSVNLEKGISIFGNQNPGLTMFLIYSNKYIALCFSNSDPNSIYHIV